MKTYKVQVERSDRWWVMTVPELPGVVSQAKKLDQVPDLALDAIALWLDDPKAKIDVELDIVGFEDARNTWRAAQVKHEQAETLQKDAALAARAAVQRLLADGVTLRDAGVVLDVSYQRVAQLAPAAGTRRTAAKKAPARKRATKRKVTKKAAKASTRK